MARNKYPEETVRLILDVTTRLFAEKGYDRTSLQDIINETKLSKGAIYHHFSSKEDILEAIFDRIGEENTAVLAKVRDNKEVNGKASEDYPNSSVPFQPKPYADDYTKSVRQSKIFGFANRADLSDSGT